MEFVGNTVYTYTELVQAGNLILNLWGYVGATPTTPPPTIDKGWHQGEWQDTMWHLTNCPNAWGARTAVVRRVGSEQQTQPCGHSIQRGYDIADVNVMKVVVQLNGVRLV